MDNLETAVSPAFYQLWRHLSQELASILDPHYVCATVAQTVAAHTGVRTLIGVKDVQQNYYDVWIGERDGRYKQTRWSPKKAAFQPLLAAADIQHIAKNSRSPAELIQSELWQLPEASLLSVPLPYPTSHAGRAATPPGLFCLIDPPSPSPFPEHTLELLASVVTTYLDRAYLRRLANRQSIEFEVVSDINYTLASKLSLQNIYKQLMNPVRETLNVESVSIGLIEQPTGDIIFVDILMGPLFADLPPIRLKKGQGIAGWVAEHAEPVLINDVYADERFYSRVDSQSGFQTRSMICIPLQVEERVIGVLQAINKRDGTFTEQHLRLLKAIAGPLAAAIENTRLHDDVIAEKRRIETIFTSMSEGLVTINAEGAITQINDALLTLIPANEASEAIGEQATDVIKLESGDLAAFLEEVLTTEEEYKQVAAKLFTQNASGDVETAPVLISGAPIKDETGQASEMIIVFSDLRQIREVERMRDDFFNGIVHELRTPLATILMYARMLRGGKTEGDPEKADRFLGVIERESDRLQKMVRQMLRLAKLESRELQRTSELVDLNELFAEMLPPMADRATQKGLVFSQKIPPDLPPVSGERETFYLIFKNLIENAIKFTLSGTVRVEAWVDAEQVWVKVKDEGIGIPQLALPNLFKRFYRTQTAVERGIAGTGLGLYMVKESVENFDGRIQVDSVEGEGTTFTVNFPVAAG